MNFFQAVKEKVFVQSPKNVDSIADAAEFSGDQQTGSQDTDRLARVASEVKNRSVVNDEEDQASYPPEPEMIPVEDFGQHAEFAIDTSLQAIMESLKGVGNQDIYKELQPITPIHWQMTMPRLLDVFMQYPQYTFFPVVDDQKVPQGIIREQQLKRFVYSRFGSTLLENPNLKDKLIDFVEPCTIVDIHDKTETVLKIYSESGTTEGVIVTADSCYVGVISLRSLIKLGYERELSLQEAHNKILEQKNNDINNILRNMKQGMLTIQEDGTIHQDYSTYLETILETTQVAGEHYFSLLFQHSNLGSDKLSQLRSTIENSIGEDVLSFEVNSHLLVEEYQISFPDNRVKHIELFWNPIVDKSDTVRRFLVNIRDKSEIVLLQEKTAQQQKEFTIISQVLSLNRDSFEEFINSSRGYLKKSNELLRANSVFDSGFINHVFRNLHTIKGNSRLYGFDYLTNVVHEVEEVVNCVRSKEIPYNHQLVLAEMQKVENALHEYSEVTAKKLQGFLSKQQKGIFFDDQLFTALKETLMNERFDELSNSIQTIVKSKKILEAHHTVSITTIFQKINASVKPMAEITGKPRPNILINNNKIRITPELSPVLNLAILHSVRNSLVHGIESQEERRVQNKPLKGTIHLVARLSEDFFIIEYWDDGAGLDLKAIMRKARDAGLIKIDKPLRPRQIAQFIFCPGLSTASEVTEIAGRGVGMDAILKAVKSVGGSIDIAFLKGEREGSSKRPFKFIFTFPVACALILE